VRHRPVERVKPHRVFDNDQFRSCDMLSASGNAKQKCKFKQASKKGNNHVEVHQRITQEGGSPQTAEEEATVEQTSETGTNTVRIIQTIQQTLKTNQTGDVSQKQNAREFAKVNQTSMTGNKLI